MNAPKTQAITPKFVPSLEIAKRVLGLVDYGLVKGMGRQVPGQMCVEAVVCAAYNLPHGDNPPCVGAKVRRHKICLNDTDWSSNKARAQGMRRYAIAQIGSDQVDQNVFETRLVIETIRQILPIALKTLSRSEELDKIIVNCEAVGTLREARIASRATLNYTYGNYIVAAAADAHNATTYAGGTEADAVVAAAKTAAAVAVAALKGDEVLGKSAEIAVQILIELKSPGCQWLYLCNEA